MTNAKTFSIKPTSEAYLLVDELANLRNTSKNKIVSEILESAIPGMHAMVKALRLAEDKNPEAFSVVSKAATEAIYSLLNEQTDLIDLMCKKPGEKGQEKEGKNASQS